MRTYSDEDLATAVSASHSWRGVLRALGLNGTSSGAMRSVRRYADLQGLDYAHFRGQRRWDEAALSAAIRGSRTWREVAERLGLHGGSSSATLRGHAARLGLDVSHLERAALPVIRLETRVPAASHLSKAGALLAAAWFELCGHSVAWPLEPCRYDLVAWHDGAARRIQVKTTNLKAGSSWKAQISTQHGTRRPYGLDEIDDFFIVTGDLDCYLIPIEAVGGLAAIHVNKYEQFRVPSPFAWPTAPTSSC